MNLTSALNKIIKMGGYPISIAINIGTPYNEYKTTAILTFKRYFNSKHREFICFDRPEPDHVMKAQKKINEFYEEEIERVKEVIF
jgi:hypothetical protein